VIVQGGPTANVYPTNVVNMIAPKNQGGNVPAISHYLICYNFGGPPPPPPPPPGNGGAAARPGQPGAAQPVTAQARFTG
jgi:hypothetical protein